MKRFICGLFATIGLLCVLFSGPITTVLPYILGGTMTAVGIAYGIVYFRNSENRAGRASELSSGLVLFVVWKKYQVFTKAAEKFLEKLRETKNED